MAASSAPADRPRDWMRVSLLDGLVALVAGGGSGIGESVAQTLAANGARVVVGDRRADMAETVAAGINAAGGQAIAVAFDVTDEAGIAAALEATRAAFGGLDILVNCAGVIAPAALEDVSLEVWRHSFAVNVEGALLLARACLPMLRQSAHAAVVNVSSLAGGSAYPNGGPYGPSKAALISLTRTMALEWAADGVRVNVVSPGTTETPLLRANMTSETRRQREDRIPMGRLGQPSELADTIVYLASPAASYVTGQNVNCDGGLSQALMVQKFQANK